jgi:Asp-tRNA(Asn)/Glu-tRNA(Gln) amidotransferase A subunit family amidase
MSNDLCFTPATDLAVAIRARTLSPVEVTEAVLARIEAINPRVNAYATVAGERALAAARAAEAAVTAGTPLEPLHGVPISFKDLTPTAGIRTTFGSKVFEHFVPEEDAAVVQRVRRAGAIILGKTNTPEFGSKGVTDNRIFGPTRNPWRLDRIAGGSSGGAGAALAAGLGPLAEGSDLAGSIRIPAAMCGVVGLKPTVGRVARYPAVNAWTSFSCVGPMARTVRDAALALDRAGALLHLRAEPATHEGLPSATCSTPGQESSQVRSAQSARSYEGIEHRRIRAPRRGVGRVGRARGYSMTWSARTKSDCGIVRPSALAVLRLMTSSNLVGCSMGKSAAFAPFRILST